jgi:hypothetical protein
MDLKSAIAFIVSFEPTLEQKLDLLTEISVTTGNDETWNASEDVRNDVVELWEMLK